VVAVTDAEVLEQCAGDVGFLWSQRAGAVSDPRYDLASLRALDARVEARLDVLREGGEAGREQMAAALGDGGGAGELFAAAVLALEKDDRVGWAELLAMGAASPKLGRGLVSALGWTLGWAPYPRRKALLGELLAEGASPEQRLIGIAASAVCRHDPGEALGAALGAEEGQLKRRALKAAGELGRRDLVPALRGALGAEDEACRFWAAWSGALLGDGGAAEVLRALARGKGRYAAPSCAMLVRRMEPAAAGTWLRQLGEAAGGLRAALAGAGALGDPALMPWVLERIGEANAARSAVAALVLLTGVDLDREKLVGEAPAELEEAPGDEEEIVGDEDDGWPWPEVEAVRRWWGKRGGAFPRGVRVLWGKPLSEAGVEEALRRGNQVARAAAAVERGLRRPERGVFEVRARGDFQAAELGA
jgi:uncharacterized protein (TIGR02270 family)